MEKAVILAAGVGNRMGSATRDVPKALLTIAGKPMLHRALEALAGVGVREVVIVVGHLREAIVSSVGDSFLGMRIAYVFSERYRTTNNVYSLWLARDHLDQDLLLLEADVVFEEELLRSLCSASQDNLAAVALYEPRMNGTLVELDGERRVVKLIDGKEQGSGFDPTGKYKTVNIYAFRKRFLEEEFIRGLARFIDEERVQDYYELVLKDALGNGRHILKGVDCTRLRWFEVDDVNDRLIADYLFSTPEERLSVLERQYGGYWRHRMTDHSLLYNVYFPPEAMREDLKREFDGALTQYPVGQATLALLLSGVIDQDPRHIVVANGASELIMALARCVTGPAAVVVPGFNEYERLFEDHPLVRVDLPRPTFELDVTAFAARAAEARARIAIVASPNNPTSLAVPRGDVVRLCELLEAQDCILLVDESFVDFCRKPAAQTLEHDLGDHPNLVILKSLSKAYGIAGIRLGYLLAADAEFAARVREEVPIWNVNGFAEAFLRLMPRYKRAFDETCARVREDRDALAAGLREIPDLTVYGPDGNFVFLRLPDSWTAPEVVKSLFVEHNLLVKDCAGKSMADGDRYIRIGSRTKAENSRLVGALAELLSRRQFAASGDEHDGVPVDWHDVWDRKGTAGVRSYSLETLLEIDGWDSGLGRLTPDQYRRMAAVVVEELDLQSGMRLLDVGCGAGALLWCLRDRGFELFGVDYSEPMLQHARAAIPEATLAVSDAAQLPFEADAIVSLSVFPYFPDLDYARKVLDAFRRAGQVALILDVPDLSTRDEAERARAAAGMKPGNHLYYPRSFFGDGRVWTNDLEGYGNGPFRFNVFLDFRKQQS